MECGIRDTSCTHVEAPTSEYWGKARALWSFGNPWARVLCTFTLSVSPASLVASSFIHHLLYSVLCSSMRIDGVLYLATTATPPPSTLCPHFSFRSFGECSSYLPSLPFRYISASPFGSLHHWGFLAGYDDPLVSAFVSAVLERCLIVLVLHWVGRWWWWISSKRWALE